MPLVVLVTVQFRRSVQQSYRRIRIAIARINSYLQEHITGMAVMQLFNREQRSRDEFDMSIATTWKPTRTPSRLRLVLSHRRISRECWRWRFCWPMADFPCAALLPVGVVVAFFQYGMRFFRPIQDLSEKYNIMQSAMAARSVSSSCWTPRLTIQWPTKAVPIPQSAGRRRVRPCWFAYKDEDWVLDDVSFRIEPGETMAVVGHTGAGKTTLSSLLLRFYEVQRGSHSHRRHRHPRIRIEDLRRNFGVVLQDPHLFTGTIAENIRLGTADISDDQLSGAAAQRQPAGLRPNPSGRLRSTGARAWRRIFHRPEAAHQFRPRSGPQSSFPDFGRSHFQRRHRNGTAHSRGDEAVDGGPHLAS